MFDYFMSVSFSLDLQFELFCFATMFNFEGYLTNNIFLHY